MNDNEVRRYENGVSRKKEFTTEEAIWIAKQLNIRFDKFDVEQFRIGLNVELEHGNIDPYTNITNNDPILTGKITLAHLNEFPDYYVRLNKMEEKAKKYWGK
ncbi:MAG: hypothetical protein MUO60_16725 [Clostridiaceae bacterium]|nr:hypothetical protein [Clostridiaceae bacterium]